MSFLRSKHSGWTWDQKRTPFGGGGGGIISAITDPISSALGTDGSGGGALGALASIDPGPAIGGALASVDKAVNQIPGGWITVGGLAAGGAALAYAPEVMAFAEANGITAPEAALATGQLPVDTTTGVAVDAGTLQAEVGTQGAMAAGEATGGAVVDAAGLPIDAAAGGSAAGGGSMLPSMGQVAGGMKLASAAMGLAGGANALSGGKLFGGLTAQKAANTADPYGQYRPQAAQELQTLLQNPSQAYGQAGYQQQLDQGMKQSLRGAAATGKLASGQELAALNQQGQNTFGAYYNSLLGNLMQLSGASQNPASAALAGQQMAQSNQAMQMAGLGAATSGVGTLANLFGGKSAASPGVGQTTDNWGNVVADPSYGNLSMSSVMSNPWDPTTL